MEAFSAEGVSWNEIPFDESAPPEVKADNFDRQIAENAEASRNESS